jgi:YegS/Rv2252/BmrU family lipid kinase
MRPRLEQLGACFKLKKKPFLFIPNRSVEAQVLKTAFFRKGHVSLRILFIINPAAGANRARELWAAFESQLTSHGLGGDKVFTTGPIDTKNQAHKAAPDYDVLVAVGGDGTVSEVANGMLSSPSNRAMLGILPIGTGNDVARELGIRTPGDVLQSLGDGRTKRIDTIAIHCMSRGISATRYALLFAGVGIIADSLKRTTSRYKRLFGQRLAYPAGLIRALCGYRSPLVQVKCGEKRFAQRFLFVGVSNSEMAGGGMKIAPGARFDDGLLNANLIEDMSRFRALLQLGRVCRGQHTHDRCVRYFATRTLEIDATASLEIAADGDLIGHTPARFSVQPQSLPVRVPAP